jgi:hypothetical protein
MPALTESRGPSPPGTLDRVDRRECGVRGGSDAVGGTGAAGSGSATGSGTGSAASAGGVPGAAAAGESGGRSRDSTCDEDGRRDAINSAPPSAHRTDRHMPNNKPASVSRMRPQRVERRAARGEGGVCGCVRVPNSAFEIMLNWRDSLMQGNARSTHNKSVRET